MFDDITTLDEIDSMITPETKIILESQINLKFQLISYKEELFNQHKNQDMLMEQNKLLMSQVSHMQIMMQQQQMQVKEFLN
jgi:hypothetical protein